MPVVSIIVPVYNSSVTIDDCLSSLTGQTLADLEIICVDDNSVDNSVELIQKWIEIDKRIMLIEHENNLGTLKTRYDGVMRSSGKYVMFIDSDDLLKPNACEILSKLMDDYGTDMLQFGTDVLSENMSRYKAKGYEYFLEPYCKELFGQDILIKQMTDISWHLWNRIYSAELCKKAYCAAGERYQIYSDDIHVSFYLSYYAQHFRGIKDKYYVYRVDKGLSGSSDGIKLLRIICDNAWYIYDCLEFLKKENKYTELYRYCARYPLCEYDHSIRVWRSITDVEDREEGMKLLKTTWDKGEYSGLLEKELARNPGKITTLFDRFAYGIKTQGFVSTLKLLFWHIVSERKTTEKKQYP